MAASDLRIMNTGSFPSPKGRHTPDIQTLKRIAKELNVPLAYLFCESDVIAEINCKIHQLSTEDQKELLKSLNSSEKNKK